MRSKGETVGVVDFGSHEIRVLIARQSEGSIQVIGHGVAPGRGCVAQGVIQDLGAAKIAFRRALTMAEKEARAKVNSLFCGIHGKNVETFIREGKVNIESGTVDQSHMDEARDIASRHILAPGKRITSSIAAQEWYVDDLRVMDPLGIRGQVLKTRIHFARIPAVIEDNLVMCIESQRRELEDIIFLPLAAALGCLTPEDFELGAAALDIGRSVTGLAIYGDYRILGSHCFEWGGYHLTRDVAAGLQVGFDEADELILEYGVPMGLIDTGGLEAKPGAPGANQPDTRIKLKTAVPGAPNIVERAELDMIIYDRARELLEKARDFIESKGLLKRLVRGVILTGGAAAIKNHVTLAESVFQTPCRLGAPLTVEILPHAVKGPAYSAAAGIVRHAFQYREAARNGRLGVRNPFSANVRRVGQALRKYFF